MMAVEYRGGADRASKSTAWSSVPKPDAGVALYVGRFTVSAAHVAIDVVFELSDALSGVQHRLRHLGRFRHLPKLTKRAADYLHVSIAR